MKVIMALASACAVLSLCAADIQLSVVKSTAKELDELVSQKNLAYKEVVRPGQPTMKYKIPPVSLNQVAPAVASRLKLNEAEVRALLANDKARLSDLVMARLIEESGGKAWKELLKEKNQEQLLSAIEERQLTTRVKAVLDELYTEVSFASLDAMSGNTAKGAAPGAVKGNETKK